MKQSDNGKEEDTKFTISSPVLPQERNFTQERKQSPVIRKTKKGGILSKDFYKSSSHVLEESDNQLSIDLTLQSQQRQYFDQIMDLLQESILKQFQKHRVRRQSTQIKSQASPSASSQDDESSRSLATSKGFQHKQYTKKENQAKRSQNSSPKKSAKKSQI